MVLLIVVLPMPPLFFFVFLKKYSNFRHSVCVYLSATSICHRLVISLHHIPIYTRISTKRSIFFVHLLSGFYSYFLKIFMNYYVGKDYYYLVLLLFLIIVVYYYCY